MKTNVCNLAKRYFVIMVALAAVSVAYMPAAMSGGTDASFTAVEKEGTKVWEGGGTVDLKGRDSITLKVTNTLGATHGFSIDTMKVQEVINPNEEKTITVPRGNIDMSVAEHRVYCQLHPKHVTATLKVTGN
jgi:hypothetical protein